MLKAWSYRLAPLLFGGNHILVIFAQNMHQKLFLRAPNWKYSLPWEGDRPIFHQQVGANYNVMLLEHFKVCLPLFFLGGGGEAPDNKLQFFVGHIM